MTDKPETAEAHNMRCGVGFSEGELYDFANKVISNYAWDKESRAKAYAIRNLISPQKCYGDIALQAYILHKGSEGEAWEVAAQAVIDAYEASR